MLFKNKILSKAIMLRRKIEKYFFCKMGVENMLNYSIVDNSCSNQVQAFMLLLKNSKNSSLATFYSINPEQDLFPKIIWFLRYLCCCAIIEKSHKISESIFFIKIEIKHLIFGPIWSVFGQKYQIKIFPKSII